jgi:hypothetical protein
VPGRPPQPGRPSQPGPAPPPDWLLWASLLATPALWLAYFMAAFVFTEVTCGAARATAGRSSVAVDTLLLVATLAVVALSALLTWMARRVGVRAARNAVAYDDFLPRLGFVVGLLFTFVLAGHLIPLVMIGACR